MMSVVVFGCAILRLGMGVVSVEFRVIFVPKKLAVPHTLLFYSLVYGRGHCHQEAFIGRRSASRPIMRVKCNKNSEQNSATWPFCSGHII